MGDNSTHLMNHPNNMASEPKLRGMARLMPAFHNTVAGLRAAWAEPAFHMEAWAALLMAPWAFVQGQTWLETAGWCEPRSQGDTVLDSSRRAARAQPGTREGACDPLRYTCPNPFNVSMIPSICSVRFGFLRPKRVESCSGVAVWSVARSWRIRVTWAGSRSGQMEEGLMILDFGFLMGKRWFRCRGGCLGWVSGDRCCGFGIPGGASGFGRAFLRRRGRG